MTNKVARVAALALAAAVTGAGAASAEEGVFMRDLLGKAGLIPAERADIDYRERAPLVIPPRMELREPGQPRGQQARGPQWPNDPDIVAARRRDADARTPVTELERRRANENNPRLSVDELRRGPRAAGQAGSAPLSGPQGGARADSWVSPEVMRRQGHAPDSSQVAEGGEPRRRTLVEPPTGLRRTIGAPVAARSEPVSVDREREEASPYNFR